MTPGLWSPWTVVRSGNYDFLLLKLIFSIWRTILSWFQVHILKTLHYRLGLRDFLRGPGVQLRLLMFRTNSLGYLAQNIWNQS